MADPSLDWNFASKSGGKNAAVLLVVLTLLESVFSHSGEFTNWWIIDGTSGNSVTFHLDVENAVLERKGRRNA